jgi:abnormal spindle-like microcephaly-associated protein
LARREQKNAPVAIFEDLLEDEELVVEPVTKKLEGRTLLGKPAQRRISTVGAQSFEEKARAQPMRDAGQPSRRSSILPPRVPESTEQNIAPSDRARQLRRRTIFVPTDATTMLTIHPGAKMRSHLNDTFHINQQTTQTNFRIDHQDNDSEHADGFTELIQRRKPVRRPRQSLSAAPRRLPLQHVDSTFNDIMFELAGSNTGKENVPPSAETDKKHSTDKIAGALVPRVFGQAPTFQKQTAASNGKQSVIARKSVPLPSQLVPQKRTMTARIPMGGAASASASAKSVVPQAKSVMRSSHIKPLLSMQPLGAERAEKQRKLREVIAAKRREIQTSRLADYPLLSEDFAQPELYDDGWLSHQEVAITETINELFNTTKTASATSTQTSLRERMIATYHSTDTSMLHKRILASLSHGALKQPKDVVDAISLSRDLGRRRRFLSLLLDSYEETSLRTAAEVVVGRQIPRLSGASPDALKAGEAALDPLIHRRATTGFLETFFVSAVDVEAVDKTGTTGDEHALKFARWRKTTIRSLMLIWLLDRAKLEDDIEGCVFRSSASKKSSSAVLQALSSLLLPATGDVTRALRHLDCEVSHVQDPLDEITYRVDNLAVDLRDGVMLTHLVETLLYQQSCDPSDDINKSSTLTITLPDQTVLESIIHFQNQLRSTSRLLSQHLKLPCASRAQKIFNVQIALSALECYDMRGNNAVADITAADIVDGHREKTIALLWSLVGAFGLSKLVNWTDLAADTARVNGGTLSPAKSATREQQAELLKDWASAYCMAEGDNIRVTNLTSSFADGCPYGAIVRAFASFIPASFTNIRPSSDNQQSVLAKQLLAIGCSATFASQLMSDLIVVPTSETTIANLALLASRLLPLSRSHRAAVSIQRAYRRHHARKMFTVKVKLMGLAADCATVVQTRHRIVGAADVIQQAWRRTLANRMKKLNNEVEAFQRLAKGWALRKNMLLTNARVKANVHPLIETRIRGGW